MNVLQRLVACTLAVLFSSTQVLAIVNGQEPEPSDTRFDAIAAYGRTDWLNCDVSCHNHYGNGTLIDSTTMLMAKHSIDGPFIVVGDKFYPDPPGTYSFRFRRKTDGSLGTIEQGWKSFHHVVVEYYQFPTMHLGINRDIAIAKLVEPVTHIDPIAIDLDLQVQADSAIILAGWGIDTPGVPQRRLNFKETTVTAVWDCDSGGSLGKDTIVWPNGIAALFDSGGAVLLDDGHVLHLVAVIQGSNIGNDVRIALDPNWELCCQRTPFYCADVTGDNYINIDDWAQLMSNWGPCSECSNCPEVNGDCVVGIDDLFIMLDQWGTYCPPPACAGDVNGDGFVDIDDYFAVLNSWGPCCCESDLNYDEVVNIDDLFIVVNGWGVCP